jgi:ribosome-binding factor A
MGRVSPRQSRAPRQPRNPRPHRPERVAELIRQTVAEFLTANVRDPRIGFVTVTSAEVSADLAHARVSVSVMGSEEEKAKSLEGLASAARFLRAQLSRELHLRTSPELRFELDRGLEHAQRIDAVLRRLKEGAG